MRSGKNKTDSLKNQKGMKDLPWEAWRIQKQSVMHTPCHRSCNALDKHFLFSSRAVDERWQWRQVKSKRSVGDLADDDDDDSESGEQVSSCLVKSEAFIHFYPSNHNYHHHHQLFVSASLTRLIYPDNQKRTLPRRAAPCHVAVQLQRLNVC